MRIRVPDYYENFRCLAGECPHTCCEKWEVVVDCDTARGYLAEPGPLGDKLRAALQYDEEGEFCFLLNGGRCPFLDENNLCEIHSMLGETATSITCREHPRFTEDYGSFQEIALSASCPAVNALLFGTERPLTFHVYTGDERLLELLRKPEKLKAAGSGGETLDNGPHREDEALREDCNEAGDPWLASLALIRTRMLALLEDRKAPLKQRLGDFLSFAADAQGLLDEERTEELPRLTAEWTAPKHKRSVGPGLFPQAFRLLETLEALEPDWRELLQRAEAAEPAAVSENLLERIAVYFAFRYLLKAVNDGDLLGRAQLCVFAVLTTERLAAVCGTAEALRRFSCEIEHSGENLEALLAAFWENEALSLPCFFRQLQL